MQVKVKTKMMNAITCYYAQDVLEQACVLLSNILQFLSCCFSIRCLHYTGYTGKVILQVY